MFFFSTPTFAQSATLEAWGGVGLADNRATPTGGVYLDTTLPLGETGPLVNLTAEATRIEETPKLTLRRAALRLPLGAVTLSAGIVDPKLQYDIEALPPSERRFLVLHSSRYGRAGPDSLRDLNDSGVGAQIAASRIIGPVLIDGAASLMRLDWIDAETNRIADYAIEDDSERVIKGALAINIASLQRPLQMRLGFARTGALNRIEPPEEYAAFGFPTQWIRVDYDSAVLGLRYEGERVFAALDLIRLEGEIRHKFGDFLHFSFDTANTSGVVQIGWQDEETRMTLGYAHSVTRAKAGERVAEGRIDSLGASIAHEVIEELQLRAETRYDHYAGDQGYNDAKTEVTLFLGVVGRI